MFNISIHLVQAQLLFRVFCMIDQFSPTSLGISVQSRQWVLAYSIKAALFSTVAVYAIHGHNCYD